MNWLGLEPPSYWQRSPQAMTATLQAGQLVTARASGPAMATHESSRLVTLDRRLCYMVTCARET
jgi:hypothetical protein